MTAQTAKARPETTRAHGAQRIGVNGCEVETAAATLAALLVELGYGEAKVATAVNGDFVPAARRDATPLAAGDRIEIVAPRQGG